MDMKDKNRSLIKEYAMKWNLHDIKRACQVNGFPAFFGIVMLFGLLSGGVSRADEEIFVSDFLTGLAVLLPIGLVWLSICLHPVKRERCIIYAQWITIQDCGGSGRHTCVQG